MEFKVTKARRIGGLVLGLFLAGSGGSAARADSGNKSDRILAGMLEMAKRISGDAKVADLKLTIPAPEAPAGVPTRAAVEDADYPWTAAQAEKAFGKAATNPLEEKDLLGRWEQVAYADNSTGRYNPGMNGVMLSFSATENPFDENRRAAVVRVLDPLSPMKTVGFAVRSPGVFFASERKVSGWTWEHFYRDGFECRLVNGDSLLCKRATTGTSAYQAWMGFRRIKQ